MIPEHFYMAGIGIYLILYLPVVLVFLWSLWRQIKHLLWPVVVPLGLVLVTLPFWDVYMTSLDASRLCKEQGGLHVHKTVEADGFLGSSSIKYWAKYGYQFTEDGAGKYMSRFTIENGEEKHEYVKSFISRYYSKTGDDHEIITKNISRSSHVVIDKETKEILSEWVTFNIHPGWFDRLTVGWAGKILWHCGYNSPNGSEIDIGTLVRATIKPKGSEGDVQ